MKVLLDTNIWLDIFLNRPGHFEDSAEVLNLAEQGAWDVILAAHSIPTLYYLLKKGLGTVQTKALLSDILIRFQIGELNQKVFISAQKLPISDYEDALVCEIAHREGCDAIVTRNQADFKHSLVKSFTPQAFLRKHARH
ncbi:MAG: PIN domain-containing protein [Candidatus Margulisiibacteriota bacterium]